LTKLCKGGCGRSATFRDWCAIKWQSGNKYAVNCPLIDAKRAKSISDFRTAEAKLGKNPMQNALICAKNHSEARAQKCSKILKEKGAKGLLPQQTESIELKGKRRMAISNSLHILIEQGRHPIQKETAQSREQRLLKMANTLRQLGSIGKLPVQNLSESEKKARSSKISKSITEGLLSGRIKLSKSWKKICYKDVELRSEWEKTVAVFLDEHNIIWEYETKKIKYFDSTRKKVAVTIPDFYLPEYNAVIEVKSNDKYKSQQTIDKLNGINCAGYHTLLVGKHEIRTIKENPLVFASQFEGVV
jgi:hypothetical protein